MNIIKRIKNKTKNFTVVSNEIFQRSDVSARAKGIYAYIMTLPDDWDLYKSELYKHFSEGRDAIDKAFKELETLGYIMMEKTKDNKGRFVGWDYRIIESTQNPDPLETRLSENPTSENPQLLNTNNNKILKEYIYTRFLEKWNTLGLVNHSEQVVKSKWKQKHTDQVKLYGEEKVFKAMENYATVLHGSSYYFNYKWTLWDFIARGLDKFVDDVNPLENFKIKNIEPKQKQPIDYMKGVREI